MSEAKSKSDLIKCPLCEGRGELPQKQLLDRLHEKDLCRKMESYLADFVAPDVGTAAPPKDGGNEPSQKKDVETWNCTHFLWRRSPKE